MERGKKVNQEVKEVVLKRMMPPHNESIRSLHLEFGISEQSLYNWRSKERKLGFPTPGNNQVSDQWSSEDKFLIVMETYVLNEIELAEYCRKKGLYKAQILEWRESCLSANARSLHQSKQVTQELKEEKKRIKELEKDLRKKEKALAEAAALLLLRKKAQSIWGDSEEE